MRKKAKMEDAGKLCDMCGNIGYRETIVTCSRCKKSSEHIYCMKILRYEVPEIWHCEGCEVSSQAVHDGKVHQDFLGGAEENTQRKQELVPHNCLALGKTNTLIRQKLPRTCKGNLENHEVLTGNSKPLVSQEGFDKFADIGTEGDTPGATPSRKHGVHPSSRNTYPKAIETGKVKYLSVDQVTTLTSGARGHCSQKHLSAASCRTNQAKINPPPIFRKKATNILEEPKVLVQPTKLSDHVNMQISTSKQLTISEQMRNDGHGTLQKNHVSGDKISNMLYKKMSKEMSVSNDVHLSSSERGTHVNTECNFSSPSGDISERRKRAQGTDLHSDEQSEKLGLEEMNQPLTLLINTQKKLSNEHVAWKGNFEVFDMVLHSYSGIEAYFPHQVSQRAYENSKKMCKTLILKLTMLQRVDSWPRTFKADPPTKDDIGLYFFPSENERAKEKYFRLLERIDSHDFAMRAHVDGVDLLIFTSRQLQEDSQQIAGQSFLWGLFRHVKHKKPRKHEQEQLPFDSLDSVARAKDFDEELNDSSGDNGEKDDMEVDMVGGMDVGRIDKPIPIKDRQIYTPRSFQVADRKKMPGENDCSHRNFSSPVNDEEISYTSRPTANNSVKQYSSSHRSPSPARKKRFSYINMPISTDKGDLLQANPISLIDHKNEVVKHDISSPLPLDMNGFIHSGTPNAKKERHLPKDGSSFGDLLHITEKHDTPRSLSPLKKKDFIYDDLHISTTRRQDSPSCISQSCLLLESERVSCSDMADSTVEENRLSHTDSKFFGDQPHKPAKHETHSNLSPQKDFSYNDMHNSEIGKGPPHVDPEFLSLSQAAKEKWISNEVKLKMDYDSSPCILQQSPTEKGQSMTDGHQISRTMEDHKENKIECQGELNPANMKLALLDTEYNISFTSHGQLLLAGDSTMLPLFPSEIEITNDGQCKRYRESDLRSVPCVSPELTLSRPGYVNGRSHWELKLSKEHIEQDGCDGEITNKPEDCSRRAWLAFEVLCYRNGFSKTSSIPMEPIAGGNVTASSSPPPSGATTPTPTPWITLEEWRGSSSTKLSRTAILTANSTSVALQRYGSRWSEVWRKILEAFVPEGFPASVTPDYVPFQVWDSLQGLSTYIRSMLSTQALLTALGVGEKSASVIGATFQWFLRDFTGMLGGIIFTFYQGSNLDSNAKMWRLVADFMNDLGMLTDLVSPLFPSALIAIVCLGSLSRSFTGVASGATRAALTQHFALENNAADISAKEGSQETMATMVGMALGMFLARITRGHPVTIWILFLSLTVFHMYANYKAVCCLSLNTLNAQRSSLLLQHFLENGQVLSPQQVSRQEQLFPVRVSPWGTSNTKLLYRRVRLGLRVCALKHSDMMELSGPGSSHYSKDNYMLLERRGHVHVIIHKLATQADILKAFIHALVMASLFNTNKALHTDSLLWMDKNYHIFIDKLQSGGWTTKRLLSPSIVWRAHWVHGLTDEKRK